MQFKKKIANQCFQLIAALAASQGKDVFAVNSYVVVTWLPPYNNDPWPALPVKNWQVTFHPAIGTCLYWQILSQVQQLVTLEQELPNPDDMMEVTPPESDSMEITPTPGIYDSAVMKNILLACKWVEENQHHFAGKIELPKILKMKEEDALLAITMRDLFINTMFYEVQICEDEITFAVMFHDPTFYERNAHKSVRSWRFHQSAVILLLVLAASFTAHGQPEDIKPRYEKFLNQHLGPDMTEKKCDSEIKHRKISDSKTPNGCKEVNTFIKANKHQINAVCDKGGTPQSNGMIKSNQPFPVITCKLKSSENKRKCEYRGNKSTRYIVVKCEKGWPVHYDEGIVNVTG
ncbi:ribonuclease-like 3 [Labeo rohita]|uniref:Ribonuclease-like 3 n=1 Tax=Labeo rohita TaxID=84645 RepID=A0A498NM61_LABRO|nr:ribonuclease-like 3 [Labeo rohita]